jgi:hypothetical protein
MNKVAFDLDFFSNIFIIRIENNINTNFEVGLGKVELA